MRFLIPYIGKVHAEWPTYALAKSTAGIRSSVALIGLLYGMLVAPASAEIHFEEVTGSAGFAYSGRSWGASWGDLDGDGRPDLWVSNHVSIPTLYLNNGDGTFTDIAQVVGVKTSGDTHGAAWADFDNDGDQDLIQLAGADFGSGSGSNYVYRNTGLLLEEQAEALGLDNPLGRGRTPLWLDRDNDGWLDVLLVNVDRPEAPTALFQQTSTGFTDVSMVLGLDTNGDHAQLSDVSGDGRVDLLIGDSQYPRRVYDLGSIPLVDLREQIGMPTTKGSVQDSVIADFNGDLLPDVFMARSGMLASDLVTVPPDSLEAALLANGDEVGFSFRTTDTVSFELDGAPPPDPDKIFLGEDGLHPDGASFTLSPQDDAVWGIRDHTPGVDKGIYIGYQPDAQEWQIFHSSPSWSRFQFVISASAQISDAATIGFQPFEPNTADRLLLSTANGFDNYSREAGLGDLTACRSAGAGDFDNDRDIDLYLVCTGPVQNLANILYENQGDSTFIPVPMAGGAEGGTEGRGESVAVADYDMDGFLDLFVTNGEGPPPFHDGPHQLFHNLGHQNHWLELDLEGVVSNRDGIGARLFLTSGGVTQLREQAGGMHARTQDNKRIHFGLADEVAVDSLIVEWPSGISQAIEGLPADQLVRLVEPSAPTVLGQPAFEVGVSEGVYLWKDAVDGPYHLRVLGAGERTTFKVKLLSDSRVVEVQPQRLERNDQLTQGDFGFELSAVLTTGQDGVDFQLPADAQALLSVERAGVSNPRQLHVGASGAPLSPAGWIKTVDELPPRTDLPASEAFGLFIGQGSSPSIIEARWSGDSFRHQADFALIAGTPFADVQGVKLESNDDLQRTSNAVRVQGPVSSGWDGVDMTLTDGADVGFAYAQDGLFQSHRVNNTGSGLGQPNAYWLPPAQP